MVQKELSGGGFQFLIGRLKTPLYFEFSGEIDGFQFLIGRLKTTDQLITQLDELVFQFLIGRLKTLHLMYFSEKLIIVSIPYR